ncbi:MFS transporter [Pullulanibacillus camelliae]|uniref:MFS transporter n=1 Tax=Pullulanibacillus camelliae TaxID=1707096 RepID=A0A8J3E102_9BACL|nr:MFS transporter [Pullulanibacillus camelliae]GGE56238.1 MFS transporter [Pullulanibacillus camelliae]
MMKMEKGPLASRQFRWFYMGHTVSLFGSSMTPVALAFAVLQVHQGQHLLGNILAAQILPSILMLLIGGSIADRYHRDRLILLSNFVSGSAQTGIAIVVIIGANPYWLFPLAILNGVLEAFTSPAMRGIIPEIVDSQDIKQANAFLGTSRSAAKIVGPILSGIFAAILGGGWGIAIDAASFFIACACMIPVHIPSRSIVTKDQSLLQQMREGWGYFKCHRWLWSITCAFALMNPVQMGAWQVLGPIIAKYSFGSAGWGLTLSMRAVGLLIASLVMFRIQLRRPLLGTMLATSLAGIPMIILGQGFPLTILIFFTIVAGIGSSISGMTWDTSLQQAIPEKMLSRVCAFDDFGSFVTISMGEILAVPLAQKFSYPSVATVGGGVFIIAALLPLLVGRVRRMTPEDLPIHKLEGIQLLQNKRNQC